MALREALYSEPSSDFLWKTCQDEHLPENLIKGVSRISGYVLLGFLHPEDLALELKEQLKLDPRICSVIATAINSRVFSPLHQELDKAYEPVSKLAAGPKMIQDIGPAPVVISSTSSSGPTVSIPQMKPAAPVPGWSRTIPEQPVVQLTPGIPTPSATPVAPKIPPRAAVPAPQITPAAPTIAKGPVDEFERLSKTTTAPATPAPAAASSTPTPTPTPAAPTPTPAPGPVIIHEDATFKPQQKVPDFHIAQSSIESFDMNIGKGAGNAPTLRPAVLELGKTPASAAPRVVHYTEYKPPVAQSGRQITEVTAPPPKPASSQATAPAKPAPFAPSKYAPPTAPAQPVASAPLPPKPPAPPAPPLPPVK